MVFQKAISRLRNLASRKAKNASKKNDISTETQTARGGHEDIQFNLDAERATNNRLTPLNKDNLKSVLCSRIRGGNSTRRCVKFDVRLL